MNSSSSPTILLAGDVGGTKTTLALYARETDRESWLGAPLAIHTYQNDDFTDFSEVLAAFAATSAWQQWPPQLACLAIAGPVTGRLVPLTNRDWSVDAEQVQAAYGLEEVSLLNDLTATATGALNLPANDLFTLNSGIPEPLGPRAVIAPGTGLGEAFILHHGHQSVICASEGGHCAFAPEGELQRDLLTFMAHNNKRVSMEMVCAGPAIARLYDFLTQHIPQPPWVREKMAQAPDRSPLIVEIALTSLTGTGQHWEPAVATLRLFTDILASEAANLALKVLATGGVYIGGGIPRRILPFFDTARFLEIFTRGVHGPMLAAMPIRIILDPHAALLGAAAHGFALHDQGLAAGRTTDEPL